MKKILLLLFSLPMVVFCQNSAIRFFPFYPMPITIFAEDKGLAFGTTLGYDYGISYNESIEFNFKPRLFILDGDEDAYELRFNVHYKRFIKNNFFTSTGIGFSVFNKDSYGPDEYTNGNPDNTTILNIGPNIYFGKRTMFNKKLFLDFGLGFSLNYSAYNRIKKTRPINDSDPEPWSYVTVITSEEKFIFPSHILVFQFGYLLDLK